jgi:chaperonin GroEL (HSP60 family)
MSLADEIKLEKYLSLLSSVITQCRYLAKEEGNQKQIWAMLDAVHNIPVQLTQWERCDENQLLEELRDYDKKWANKPGGKSLISLINK